MLNSHVATVVAGHTFHTDGGITLPFGLSAAGAAVSEPTPKPKRILGVGGATPLTLIQFAPLD